jgi:hypothetical protein
VIRLAALDSARPPQAPVLLAELDGELCVAVSLVDLKSVADPFRITDGIRAVALARAAQARTSQAPPARTRSAKHRSAHRAAPTALPARAA